MYVHNLNPVLISLGPVSIRWYGLIYALGFVIAYFMLPKLAAKLGKQNITKKVVEDYLIYLVLGVVIGARFVHVFVYEPAYYFQNPHLIPAMWLGGLSFHGGFLGAIAATWLFCRKQKIAFLDMADLVVIPAALALGLGRIANFINGELYGEVTDVPWAVLFPGQTAYRHPTQIYESLSHLFTFGVLMWLRERKPKRGTIFVAFTFIYGLLRFLVEFVRDVDIPYFGLTLGQWMSMGMMVFAVWFYFFRIKKGEEKN
ncbi:MAG: prolipoprotein diacylglyceryl transferase [Nanoarchaeota archaeon]